MNFPMAKVKISSEQVKSSQTVCLLEKNFHHNGQLFWGRPFLTVMEK